jgi:Holliday junction resolvasome RuvABC endonuclease subunit|tara:strand:+ start:2827 stop:3387 length:561 start_codon:yes stop_codon:yes gene_type:complete
MIIGIDYSMTSPAICVGQIPFSYDTCKFMFITRNKKLAVNHSPSIVGLLLYEYNDNLERFTHLADQTVEWILSHAPTRHHGNLLAIEGYAFGAKGQVFNIGENTGILKYKLAKKVSNIINVIAPSAIKKFATGKGNANKLLMYEAFVEETGDDLAKLFEFDPYTGQSPVSDIVDSYYIAKYNNANT